MTDRPIIFSAPMIRALLAGTKTQTRRLMQRGELGNRRYTPAARIGLGDRLWVREAFCGPIYELDGDDRPVGEPQYFYRADGYPYGSYLDPDTEERRDQPPWHPSIHMPRGLSRLTLTVTGLDFSRLQEITEDDAIAEGAFKGKATGRVFNNVTEMRLGGPEWRNARDWYADLWDQINGAGSWDENPLVVALTFTVECQNVDALKRAKEGE